MVSKKNLGYAFKNAAYTLRGIYLMNADDAEVAELDKFIKLFEYRWPNNFRESETTSTRRRLQSLRRPDNLPSEQEIGIIRTKMEEKIDYYNSLSDISASQYTEIRRTVLSRLILFNAMCDN